MKLIFTGILLLTYTTLWAQKYEKELRVDKPEKFTLALVSDSDGKKLTDLPVTLQLTNKNILIVMFGNGKYLQNNYCVWLFSPEITVKDFLEKNKNVAVSKEFKKSHIRLYKFYGGKGFEYIDKYNFDNGYETIRRNPRPAFFQVTDNTVELYLYFYVSATNKKTNLNELITKTKPVKITIKIVTK